MPWADVAIIKAENWSYLALLIDGPISLSRALAVYVACEIVVMHEFFKKNSDNR